METIKEEQKFYTVEDLIKMGTISSESHEKDKQLSMFFPGDTRFMEDNHKVVKFSLEDEKEEEVPNVTNKQEDVKNEEVLEGQIAFELTPLVYPSAPQKLVKKHRKGIFSLICRKK